MSRPIDTICRDCVFALYDLDDVQDGCAINRLEGLASNGAELIQEEGEDSTYYRIKGRFCNAVRNEEWSGRQGDQSASGLIEAVEDEVRIKPLGVIYAGPESTDEDVERSIASLKAQTVPVKHLTVCFSEEFGRAERWAARLQVEHPGCTWNVINGENPTDHQLEQYGDDPYLRMVDEAVYESDLHHYTAAHAGFEWPPNYLAAFNSATQVEMKRVLAALPAPNTDYDGYLAFATIHKQLYENRGEPFCEKILKLALSETEFGDMSHTIMSWKELGLEKTCES